ncbi:nucleotidyl transferase AbiEii/AbiGii toxin family protein [Pseudoflavitalea sp. X16]|uniref:nucleotidyl transferase AbiEii/AbiGii toxin family protein n=1 Tax=Paraflavitalea devenefica TaxID=2716334 RepID=UPI001420E3B2|nr:nucleotidyl transferase AbiEii/AbiGii toxin family protein [Paraflavitalea devenefica]NII25851.1 nucleotidyl transferase AbiEii/AbiGii toxin family protein [Paraflavitalea devenefica]
MLHRKTTGNELFNVLVRLMGMPVLTDFRLVGGTALSLLRGHRESVDIDMFCDGPYGEIPFYHILEAVKLQFPYVEETGAITGPADQINNQGLYLFIGDDERTSVKTDILYWDAPFLDPPIEEQGIRLATIEDIAAMKLDTISRGGRKKDFWDLSEILETHRLVDLLAIYQKKYPWHEIKDVFIGLTNFTVADQMPDPVCYKHKNWEAIKAEMEEEAHI